MKNENKEIVVYTDGACANNPGVGGWGAFILYPDSSSKELFGYEAYTTNNRMEMFASIAAIEYLKKETPPSALNIHIYTDSTYLKNGITKWIYDWEKSGRLNSESNKKVKNLDLWLLLLELTRNHMITWSWVKGHSDNKGNIMADMLAQRGVQSGKEK